MKRDDFTFVFPEGAVRRRDMTREQLERVVDWMIEDRRERMNREIVEYSFHPYGHTPKMTTRFLAAFRKAFNQMEI